MTQPIRFLFDECLSRPVVEKQIRDSLSLYEPDAVVAHLLSYFPIGVKEPVWIPTVAAEGGWVIITMDRGTHSRVSERLPLICQAYKLTHVMLSPGLEKRNMYYRTTAIEACWPALIEAASAPPGSGYVLSMRITGQSTSFHLTKLTEPLSDSDAPRIQKKLSDQWESNGRE